MTGTIRRVFREKFYGFIKPDSTGEPELFFHKSGLVGVIFESLCEGQRVRFDSVESPKGPRAQDVNVIA